MLEEKNKDGVRSLWKRLGTKGCDRGTFSEFISDCLPVRGFTKGDSEGV